MKYRNGFVSNSSSSSFIVDLYADKQRSIEEVFLVMEKVEEEAKKLDLHFNSCHYRISYVKKSDFGDFDDFDRLKKFGDRIIVVESSSDNSIPEDLFEMIEDELKTSNYAL